MKEYDKPTIINIHLVEFLLTGSNTSVHSHPYILAAYGINNRFKAIDVVRQCSFLYHQCKDQDIRLVGFGTDCDSRYVRVMQLSLEFFAELPNFDQANENNEVFNTDYPQSWNFFFMRSKQPFFFMQDAVYLSTKVQNRLLSRTATTLIGIQYVSLNHLAYLIGNYSKVDHNLVKPDAFPRDLQNFSSFLKNVV